MSGLRRATALGAGGLLVALMIVGGGAATSTPAGAQITIPPLSTTTTTTPTTTAAPTTTTRPAPTTTEPEAVTTVPVDEPIAGFDDVPFVVDTSPTTVVAPDVTTPTSASVAPARPAATGPPITAAVVGAYGLGSASVLLFALVLIGLATHGRSLVPAPTGGSAVNDLQRRWRLYAGFGVLALAGIVALVGYLQLSEEPAVNRQLPYLASAGMAIVILSAIGGSLVVGEQLRTETRRVSELEEAVRHLSDLVAGDVERPARRKGRSSGESQP